MTLKSTLVAGIASAALLGLYQYNYSGPNEIEYDADGNEMRLMDDQMLQELFSPQAVNLDHFGKADNKNSEIPKQFWTTYNITGHESGYGLQEGYERVVFKSYHGKYLGVSNYGTIMT